MMNGTRPDRRAEGMSRRAFLRTAAAGALAMPTLIPASALGRGGAVAPSERIVLGGIGVGNRGSGVLRGMLSEPDIQFVADCDARRSRREAIKKMVDEHYGNQDCAIYPDLREFLAVRTDLDAVLIATGDRLHALASVYAMRAGKDVYCEKPTSMTIAEGRLVVDTARRYGRIHQSGMQRLSEANFIFANEMVRSGRLGKVHTVRAHIAPWDAAEMRHDWLPGQTEPPKDEMDWDAWLGPCPWRPYNETYVNGGWRGHYDFHTSCIGEWGSHTFAQCHDAIGALTTAASEYEYVENKTGDGMVVRFANGVKMILNKDGWPGSAGGWKGSCGICYEGTEGWVSAADGYSRPEVSSPAMLSDFDQVVRNYVARTSHVLGHHRDLFNGIRARRRTIANPELMHASMSTVHGANICMWLKRSLKYDPVKEEFIGDPEANRFRSRAMRAPWVM